MTMSASDFADIVLNHAMRLDLSIEEVAEQAKLDLNFVEKMVYGEGGRPGFMGLKKLAQLFGPQFLIDVFELEENEDPQVFTYTVPINPNQDVLDEVNERMATDYHSTEWHIVDLLDKIEDKVIQAAKAGGSYIGDAVEVKAYIWYAPESK